MDVGFDERTLALNHLFFGAWSALLLPTATPLALLAGDLPAGLAAVVALWTIAGLALLAVDALAAYRLLTGD